MFQNNIWASYLYIEEWKDTINKESSGIFVSLINDSVAYWKKVKLSVLFWWIIDSIVINSAWWLYTTSFIRKFNTQKYITRIRVWSKILNTFFFGKNIRGLVGSSEVRYNQLSWYFGVVLTNYLTYFWSGSNWFWHRFQSYKNL